MKLTTSRIAIVAVFAAFLAIILLWIFLFSTSFDETASQSNIYYLLFFGSTLVAIISLLLKSSVRIDLGKFDGTPDQARKILSYSLRKKGLPVEEKSTDLKVRISKYNSIKIITERRGDSTEIEVVPDSSVDGWMLMVLMMVFGYLGLGVVPFVLLGLSKAASFADNEVAPMVKALAGRETACESDVRAILIEGLSESYRLSMEAYDSERSNHQDRIFLSIFLALALWTAFFIMGFWAFGNTSVFAFLIMLSLDSAMAVLLVLASWLLLTRNSIPRLTKIKSHSDELLSALQREVQGGPWESGRSTFEVLRDACNEIPEWIGILRRSSAYRESAAVLLIFSLGYIGVNILVISLTDVFDGNPLSYLLFILGILIIVSTGMIYRRFKLKRGHELDAAQEELMRRINLADRKMQEILFEEGETDRNPS